MSDVQYTQYELPIIEIEIDDEINHVKIEKFKENCFAIMQNLNISNAIINFKSQQAIDQYLSIFSHPIEGLNMIAKFKPTEYIYAANQHQENLKAYSDAIVEAYSEELNTFSLPVINDFYPMLQVCVKCDAPLINAIDTLLEDLQNVGTTKCILLEPDYRTEINFKSYNTLIEKIFHMSSGLRIFLERGNYPVQIIRKHPCNVYILSCANCHSGKKDLPRVFTIKSNGQVFPEGMDEQYNEFLMGNIFETKLDELLEKYRFSENHLRFKEVCKKIYHEFVLDYPFSAFPWRYFYMMKAKEVNAND